MPTLQLTEEQVIELVRQLPPARQRVVLQSLLSGGWEEWAKLSSAGVSGARAAAAARGRDWEAMTEEQREAFIDDVLHEDRK